jgi:hypothetical protein
MCDQVFSSAKFNIQVFNFALDIVMQEDKDNSKFSDDNTNNQFRLSRFIWMIILVPIILIFSHYYIYSVNIKI